MGAFIKRNWRSSTVFRYSVPVLTVGLAVAVQICLALYVPGGTGFPFAFLYLLAALVSAWYGGYVPGVISCLIPIAIQVAARFAGRPSAINLLGLLQLILISLLISKVEETQRRVREKLQTTADDRTRERDIALSGRRRTEAALIESEERIAFALEAAEFGHLDLDLTTGLAQRSPRDDQIFGYDTLLPDWSWNTALDHIVPEDRPAVTQCLSAAVREGTTCQFECRIRPHDADIRWILVRGRILRDAAGRAVRMSAILADITERKLAEQRLRAQLERLSLLDRITRATGERQDLPSIFQVVIRTLEDSLPIDFGCVCLHDADTRTLTVTSIGIKGAALAAELAMQPNARIDVGDNGLSQCVKGRLVYEHDLRDVAFPFPERLARSGLRAMVAAPLQLESRVFGVLICARSAPNSFTSGECEFLRQLSEHIALAAHQAQIYAALQQSYDDLRQTQQAVMQQERLRALGQMASGIAHDINNALSPVALYTESMLETERNISPRGRKYLETIQRAIEDVAQTVARMREFYRRRDRGAPTRVDLGRLAHQTMDLTRARWNDMPQQRGVMIEFRLELAPNLPPVGGVESEIRELLTNLIFNAVDAMPEGGVLTLRTKTLTAGGEVAQAQIEVSDTGIGMNEETRRRCLEPFFTTKGERGTGLGLAMVYGAAERHNATIDIESSPGAGTAVRLLFPAMAGNAAAEQPQVADAPPRGLRLLVVDDDPLLIRSLRDTLEVDGHEIVTANGGKEGIETFSAAQSAGETFAAVITDLGMPYVDGRQVAAAVKSHSPATPVILLTGWGQRLVAEEGVPEHVDIVLNKPPKVRDLRNGLARVTRNGKPVVKAAGQAH